MAKKIYSLDEVIGHKYVVNYFKQRIETMTLPNMIILYGSSGIGKSAIAKIVACEVAGKVKSQEFVDKLKDAVIRKDQDTDCIKLFNMSTLSDKEEEIRRVVEEMNTTFSSTGIKFLILDEAHGMSNSAQDSILVELERLPDNVYVILCTTELNGLKDAIISRCKSPIALNSLSSSDFHKLITRAIEERRLTFPLPINNMAALIANWSENQPRKALNFLENFPPNSIVKREEVEIFINTNAVPEIIQLVKYLYGNLSLGLDYISGLKLDSTFVLSLIEVVKVVLGGSSKTVSAEDAMHLREFLGVDKDIVAHNTGPLYNDNLDNLLQFLVEVTKSSRLTRTKLTSAFVHAHVTYYKRHVVPSNDDSQFRRMDLDAAADVEKTVQVQAIDNDLAVESLDELFSKHTLAT